MMTQADINKHTYDIINVAIEVHKSLGPGLLESVYHRCMEQEMKLRKLSFKSELIVPIEYKGLELDANLRCDFLYADCIVVELKSVDAIAPVFQAQLITYMKFAPCTKRHTYQF